VLTAPPDVAQWFTELFSRIDFAPFTGTGHPFTAQQLLARHLTNSVLFETGSIPEAGVASTAAFVHMRAQ